MSQTVIGRAPIGYLMKYLSKTGPLQAFPKGARIHGYGGLTGCSVTCRLDAILPMHIR